MLQDLRELFCKLFSPSTKAIAFWVNHLSLPFLLGVLFLQYGDETRRVHITHELSSLDTLHALIVHMFPQKLTAGMLKSPNTAILIKDEARNVFYELEDVRDIQDRSIIKIYRKEPIYASYPAAAHLANGDLRVRKRELGEWGDEEGQLGYSRERMLSDLLLVWCLTTEPSVRTATTLCLYIKKSTVLLWQVNSVFLYFMVTLTGCCSVCGLVI